MEAIRVAMEKIGVGSNRSKTFLVLLWVALPVAFLITVMYRTSPNLSCIKGASEWASGANNVTGKDTFLERHNITSISLGIAAKNNVTAPARSGSENGFPVESKDTNSEPGTSKSNDVLHDGLVAPGWDEGSCISRFRSHLYRRSQNSTHKPSRHLISKLRGYEDLHRRCGPHSASYKRAMADLVRSRHRNVTSTGCKYMAWTPTNGLGNRMLSMVAGFLWSVLTDRVLLVSFDRDMIGLFCQPFPNSTWILPKDFPHKGRYNLLPTYESLLNVSVDSQAPQFLYLRLSHGNEDHVKFFHCKRSHSLLENVAIIVLESDQYFVPSLFMEESFREELNRMFPEKVAVFHLLGKYLFKPSNEAWGLITRFYQAYLSKAEERIGLQIRVFDSEGNRTRVMEAISGCTSKNKLLPELGEPLTSSSTSPHKNNSSTAVLVASLYSEFAENLRTIYWTNPTVTGETIAVHQPSHDGYQKFNDRTQNMQAWAEIYLLSLCDELVTSAWSTFGYVAQSLGGLKPWILLRKKDEASGNYCKRALSMEPCFHFPPRFDCETKAKLDIPSRFPYIKSCEDFYSGVKMVDEG